MTPDARGLLTRTRIAKTELGDEVLELAREGAITGFSFRAAAMQTTPHAAGADGLPTLERTEFRLREYGPGVFVAYDDAEILAVRAQHWADHLTDAERDELRRALDGTPPGPPSEPADPADPGHSGPSPTDRRREALRIVRQYDLKGLT
jgi:phage head maturation protease